MSEENKPVEFINFVALGPLWFLFSLAIIIMGIFMSNRIPGSLVKIGFPPWLAKNIYLVAIPLSVISVRVSKKTRRRLYRENGSMWDYTGYFDESVYINLGGAAIPLAISAYIGIWFLINKPMGVIYYLIGIAITYFINKQLSVVDVEGVKVWSLLISYTFSAAGILFIIGMTGGMPMFYPYGMGPYNYLDVLVAGSMSVGMFLHDVRNIDEFFRVRRSIYGRSIGDEDAIIIGALGIGDIIFIPQIVTFFLSPAVPL